MGRGFRNKMLGISVIYCHLTNHTKTQWLLRMFVHDSAHWRDSWSPGLPWAHSRSCSGWWVSWALGSAGIAWPRRTNYSSRLGLSHLRANALIIPSFFFFLSVLRGHLGFRILSHCFVNGALSAPEYLGRIQSADLLLATRETRVQDGVWEA